jgi:antibiotic biosynthesis monooxygenase (ABM) superfamily enzyme
MTLHLSRYKQGERVPHREGACHPRGTCSWASFFVSDGQPRGAGGPPPRYRSALVVFVAVWITVTLLSFETQGGNVQSLNPTLRDHLELPTHPERIPLSVFLSNLVAIPIIVFLLVPLLSRWVRPWLKLPGPTPPENKVLRWLFDVVV